MIWFDWSTQKAVSNFKKHQVSFNEAATIFSDPMSFTFPDHDHSINEQRYITIGLSEQNRCLIVAHTDENEIIRIISARRATRKEINYYEENR